MIVHSFLVSAPILPDVFVCLCLSSQLSGLFKAPCTLDVAIDHQPGRRTTLCDREKKNGRVYVYAVSAVNERGGVGQRHICAL